MSEETTLDEFVDAEFPAEREETPIGELPGDWGVKWLDDVVDINPDGFSEEDWPSETFEYISLSEASEGELLESNTIPLEEAPSRAQRQVRRGDVLVGTVRPKQESHGFVTDEHDGDICSSGFGVLRTGDNLNSLFLTQEILSHRFFSQMDAYVAGSGYPAVKIGDLKKHRISVPSLEEQRKIATVLHDVDQAIQKTKETIVQAGRVRKDIEQKLFTGGFYDHENIEKRRLVEFPDGWNFEQFSEHTIESLFGPRYDSDKYIEGGNIATLRTTDLDKRGNITHETMPRASLDMDEFEKHLLQKGDVVISRSGAYSGITTTWDGYDIPTIPGAYMIRFRLKDSLNPDFLRYYFNSSSGKKRINRRKQGSGQQNIAGSDLLNMRIPIPDREEQIQIVDIIESIETKILFEKTYSNRLQRLKQALMQDLLSGKVRTTDSTIAVPDEVRRHG